MKYFWNLFLFWFLMPNLSPENATKPWKTSFFSFLCLLVWWVCCNHSNKSKTQRQIKQKQTYKTKEDPSAQHHPQPSKTQAKLKQQKQLKQKHNNKYMPPPKTQQLERQRKTHEIDKGNEASPKNTTQIIILHGRSQHSVHL